MAIIVLQHAPTDHLGRLAPIFRDLGHKLDVRRVDLATSSAGVSPKVARGVPTDLDDVDGLIVLGGPMNVGDNPAPAWMAAEIELVRAAHAAALPLVGICLGHQIIAHALGGEVGPSEKPEVGFCQVTTLVPGQTDTVLAGIPWQTMQFQAHAQEIKKLPLDATALMASPACNFQAFRVGLRTYGFQFHFELLRSDIDGFARDAFTNQLAEQLGQSTTAFAGQAAEHMTRFDIVGDRLGENLAGSLFPVVRRLRA